MIYKSAAVVLNTVKFSDSDLIAHLYTLEHGSLSFILKGIRKARKGGIKTAQFQPLTLLDISYTYKNDDRLNYIRECRCTMPLHELYMNPLKNAISLFMGDLVHRSLRMPQPDPEIFEWLSIQIIDLENTENVRDFPIQFTLGLMQQLGIAVQADLASSENVFNLNTGNYDRSIPGSMSLSEQETKLLERYLGTKVDQPKAHFDTRAQRNKLLAHLLDYMNIHLEIAPNKNMLNILNEIL